mgnify:CR=1 FL=1
MLPIDEKFQVQYFFTLPDGSKEEFTVVATMPDLSLLEPEGPLPDWTRLEYHKCSNCPLQEVDRAFCPIATQFVDIGNRFGDLVSYGEISLEVVAAKHRIIVETDVQNAVRSLMGLIMALSDCPHMAFFKPLAKFHLPLGDMEETMVRSMSFYLLGEHFKQPDPAERDTSFSGLALIYHEVNKVNQGIAERLRQAEIFHELNSLTILDNLAHSFPLTLDKTVFDVGDIFSQHPK